MRREGSTAVRRRSVRRFGRRIVAHRRRVRLGVMVHGSCARCTGLSIMVRGIYVKRTGRGSSRDTDEHKSSDATERSELYKCVSRP